MNSVTTFRVNNFLHDYEHEPEDYGVLLSFFQDSERNGSEYRSTLKAIRDRLDLMGFNRESVKEAFDTGVREWKKALANENSSDIFFQQNEARDEIKAVLEVIQIDDWVIAFSQALRQNIESSSYSELKDKDYSPRLKYVVAEYNPVDRAGFPDTDFRIFMRAIAEISDFDVEVVLDVSSLLKDERFDSEEYLCERMRNESAEDYIQNQRIIVLTEGKTDADYLKRSLKILYPHLEDYFAFMEFENSKAEKDAGTLVRMVKSFIAVGIVNRIVAIFDNDIAAWDARKGLKGVELPSNVRVINYPDLAFAKNYPTIEEGSVNWMDVNGRAGAIEIYFGNDVLKDAQGNLTPIVWGKGTERGERQGKLQGKGNLQKKFEDKLKRALANPPSVETDDWSGMKAILDALRNAFNEETPQNDS